MKEQTNRKLTHNQVLTIKGVKLFAEVSPCCWMYPNYGMQVKVSAKPNATNAESLFVRWTTTYADSNDTDLLSHVTDYMLDRDGFKELRDASAKWAQAQVDFDKAFKAEQKQAANERVLMKADGFTHVITAVIHPKAGGDDFIKVWYVKRPESEGQIRNRIRLSGSAVLDDYTQEAL